MPTALTNLFCHPVDIYDLLGVPATEMRLDDNNLATGQTVTVTADAALGATTVFVMPVTVPMPKGNTLRFTGGGAASVVEAVLSATALVGDVTLTVDALPANLPASAVALDSGVNVALAARLLKACNYGTSQVLAYCLPRYNESDLVGSWDANRWASTLGAEWFARRVLRPLPETVKEDAKQVRQELKECRNGQWYIANIAPRSAGWPFLDNMSVDIRYTYHKLRVEQSMSEGTPTQFVQYVDFGDAFWGGLEGFWG